MDSFYQAIYENGGRDGIHVLLTYAQSLDGFIAGSHGRQITLSCKESMAMTHNLRLLSDAIVVGSGTLVNDNPGLNARVPVVAPLDNQPTPIAIDPEYKMPVTAKLISNYHNGIGKQPILLAYRDSPKNDKRLALEESGVKVVDILTPSTPLNRQHFNTLSQIFGFTRFMVEGGATVIKSILAASANETSLSDTLADTLVVTVSPVLIGDGVSVVKNQPNNSKTPNLHHKASKVFGGMSDTDKKIDDSNLNNIDAVDSDDKDDNKSTPSNSGGAYDPETGEINWDCPCLGGMAHGPCGEDFKSAFSCFVYSEADPKGIDCVEAFKGMQDCFRSHPEHYSDEIADDDDDANPDSIDTQNTTDNSDAPQNPQDSSRI
ncbi:hypothetical protein E3P88_03405 [Wallemia ichthyophaga]|uniref:2,5-diamino-6-ribosylamino-4(3H)-pyrimidinone 5'-phosphate reductase n=1 Tax=Wallemia ichthyophaga TaxID=245174 RepID=A0A4T0H1S1_WALIC|nr:hypothetical protein E3P90_03392 [Wallemia ichthyophaga]TIB21596.1 hypothetical protein E3P88_03405 [Wallemia ichthyophaga]